MVAGLPTGSVLVQEIVIRLQIGRLSDQPELHPVGANAAPGKPAAHRQGRLMRFPVLSVFDAEYPGTWNSIPWAKYLFVHGHFRRGNSSRRGWN